MSTIQSLGFLGFGRLAQLLYQGFKTELSKRNIMVFASDPSGSAAAVDGIEELPTDDLLARSTVVFIAVKPQQLPQITNALNATDWTHRCLLSVLAGTKIDTFIHHIPSLKNIIRIMPNTAAAYNASMTVSCSATGTQASFIEFTNMLFSSVGTHVCVDEQQMDICTALFGSGPAFFYALLEPIMKLAQSNGFDSKTARLMSNQLLMGVAQTLHARPDATLDTLISEISSPNGTTEAGLTTLNNSGIIQSWEAVFTAAQERAKELSKDT